MHPSEKKRPFSAANAHYLKKKAKRPSQTKRESSNQFNVLKNLKLTHQQVVDQKKSKLNYRIANGKLVVNNKF